MIIKMLLDTLYNVFNLLTAPINIPDLPPEAESYLSNFFDYLASGAALLANFVPFAYLMTLFGVILAVDAGILLYHFVMWIIRKIPVAGMS